MAPSKKKAKKAAMHGLSDLLGSDWSIHSSKGLDYPNDLDYPSNDSDYPEYMEEDDTDSHSDQCLLMSGHEQTMAEGRARAHTLAAKHATKKKALAAKLAAKRNKANDGEEAADEDYMPSEAADDDYPPADEDAMPCEVADGGATGGEAYNEDREIVGEEREDIFLTDKQVSSLQRQLGEFRTADPETRLSIIQDSVAQIERTWMQDVDFDREIIEKLVCRHLHSRHRQDKETPNFHKIWTYTDIVIDFHQEEMDKLAAKMSGAKAGSPAYLGCYKRAIKTINDQLDEEMQVKLMEKYGQSTLQDFSVTMYHQFGVWVIVLPGYCDADGEPTVMLYDINDEMGVTSFKKFHKWWQSDPLVDNYSKWTAESLGVQPRNGGQDNGKNNENPKNIKLPMNRHGYLMLPSWEAINQEGHAYKKLLIGKFMTQLYKVTAGGSTGRIPWVRLSEALDDFILPQYLPNGVTLTQYHHICIEDADALLKHWTQRQAAREILFWFKSGVNANQCGKKVSVNDDTSSPVGPRNQPEGTLQDSQENQEQVFHGTSQGGGEGSSKKVPGRQGRGDAARNSNKSFPCTSNKRSAKAAEACKEVPTEEDGEDEVLHSPNLLRLATRVTYVDRLA
ncbi:hypothetical protein EI94DRAFT_1704374 [Lactarius quietus]|nr:hypothetical protein EI94DRAFT_1704374 [Lactarius quietus]